jgi:transposase
MLLCCNYVPETVGDWRIQSEPRPLDCTSDQTLRKRRFKVERRTTNLLTNRYCVGPDVSSI